jgi:hypothetical protein
MKYINKIRNFYIPFDYPKFALVISIAAFAFAASSHNTPCLSAQSTCSVGSDNEFTGNISLKGGTAYKSTLDASGITADRTLTIPDNTGTLALTSDITPPSYTPDAPFLKVDGTGTAVVGSATVDAPFVSVDASGQLDSSATLTADAPFLSADASGQIAAGGSLTASTPLKSSATGQIAASDLDITTDITPGSALQEIRVNSGGTALEYFTPSGGGGRWTLVGQGQMSQSSYTMGACWYDDTQGTGIGGGLDQTKVYKLVVEPTGSMGTMGNNGSYPAMVAMNETNCSNIASSGNYLFSSSVTNNGFWVVDTQGWHASFNSYVNAPWLGYQQHTTSNSSSSKCGGASITMIIRNGIGNVSVQNTKNEGVKFTDIKSAAPCYDSGNNITGWQQADSSGITWDSTQSYAASPVDNMNQMTGIQFKRYDGGGSFSQPVWYLYESDY